MSNDGDFSIEDSEDLIANLNSGKPTQFEQLRSTLNLIAHVTELPPTSIPPVLPSGISQPVPIIPVKPANPRRTIVTSVIVLGMFASASLAAAAVTGIGPAPIVNIGHQTAKFVKGVAGAVTHVVTGGNSDTNENAPSIAPVPGLTPAPTGGEESSSENSQNSGESESESLKITVPGLLNPLTSETKKSNEGNDGKSNAGQKSNESKSTEGQSHESQSNNQEDSSGSILSIVPTPSIKIESDHSESDDQKVPEISKTPRLPTALPLPNSSEQSSDDD